MARNKNDNYSTPVPLARACLLRLIEDGFFDPKKHRRILEPSVGRGAWLQAMELIGKIAPPEVIDIDAAMLKSVADQYKVKKSHRGDFLDLKLPRYDLIAGNPPYARGTGRFNKEDKEILEPVVALHVNKALQHADVVGYLLRLAFIAPKRDRKQIWLSTPPARVYPVDPRPSFAGGPTEMTEYAFVVWAKGNTDAKVSPLFWNPEG